MTIQKVRIAPPLFGEPTLISANNGNATWSRPGISPYFQKGSGWTANLYGGLQTGWDDWAAVYIPVNELHLTDFNSALWSYYMTEGEAFGVNIVLWVHDPNDSDKRAEITQLASVAGLEKSAGWNAHELNLDTAQFFFQGENTDDSDLTADPPNYYSLNTFKSDALFIGWTIYRISFEYGWETGSNEFKDVWVADIKLNGLRVLLQPDSGGTGRIGKRYFTGSASISAGNAKLSPKTPFRLLSVSMHIDAEQTSTSSFVLSVLSGHHATYYDVDILTDDMDVPSGRVSLYAVFGEGYEFTGYDEIDLVYTNGGTKNYGLIYTYEVL